MKTVYYFLIGLLLGAGVWACSDDKGNYDYIEVNKITIRGIPEEITMDQYDTLWMDTVQMEFSLGENKDLSYEWYFSRELISSQPNCGVPINADPDIYHNCWLCVTDNTNNLKYYKDFMVRVNSPFSVGLYVLSETQDGTAKLSRQRRDKENAPMEGGIFELCNPDLGILGKKPVQLAYADGWTSNTRGMFVFCQEGERKISLLSDETVELEQYWNETSIEDYSGVLTPKFYNCDMGGLLLDETGKVFTFNYSGNNTLYKPLEGYNFSWVGSQPNFANELSFVYDEDKQMFAELSYGDTPLLFDQVDYIDTLDTKGQKYRTFTTMNVNSMGKVLYPVLYDPETGKEHYYELNVWGEYDDDWNYYTYYSYTQKMERPALMDANSVCLLSDMKYWYVSKGNKLIRYFFSETSAVADWIPELEGVITALLFNPDQDSIFVAVYDGTNSYIYEFSAINPMQELKERMAVEGRVVSMVAVGESDWLE